MPFAKGQPAGPGRPKGSVKRVKFLLAEILADHDFDWGKHLAQAFMTQNRSVLSVYEKFAPYLFAPLRVKEFEIRPDTPEQSAENAERAQQLLKALEGISGEHDANRNG